MNKVKLWTLCQLQISALIFASALVVHAAPETARSADSFVDTIGINVKLGYTDTPYWNYTMVKSSLQQAGIRHIRDGVSADPTVGATANSRINDLGASGIKSTIIFSTGSYPNGTDPNQGVVTAAGWVSGGIEMAEGTNEGDGGWNPNNPNPTGFIFNGRGFPQSVIDFQNVLWGNLKNSQYSSLPIVAPSISFPPNSQYVQGMQYVSNYGNTHSYHGARNPGTTEVNLDLPNFYLGNAHKETGNLPVISTETGNWTGTAQDPNMWMPPITEYSQGKYALRTYAEYFNAGIVRTFIHELIDEHPENQNVNVAEQNFGILHNDWSPKSAYTDIKNLTAILGDPGASFTPGALNYTVSGNTANVHHMLLQKRDGTFYLVLWQEVKSYDNNTFQDLAIPTVPVTVNLGSTFAQAAILQPSAGPNPGAIYSNVNTVTVNVPDDLTIIKLSPTVGLSDLIVTAMGYSGNATPGAPITFTATIKNIGTGPTPTGSLVAVGFYLQGASGPLSWGSMSGSLAPGASANITADFSKAMSPGSQTVVGRVDDVNRIPESNENNNAMNEVIAVK